MSFEIPEWCYARGRPQASAVMRRSPEDFVVAEILGFDPDGDGEHAMLRIRKRGENSEHVARRLARLAAVRPVAVGYAGMKDRHAVTTQWFTVHLAGRPEPDWSELESDTIEVAEVTRHRKKLRRGALQGNHFVIILRDVSGDGGELASRLEQVRAQGVPNYFGGQRFGHDNIDRALAMLRGEFRPRRHQRGLYLSAARALLFNVLLSARVGQGSWDRPLAGDVMMLDGTHSIFAISEVDDEIAARCRRHDIHPTGPLPGCGGRQPQSEALAIEQAALQPWEELRAGLEQARVEAGRRALRALPQEFTWHFQDSALHLSFFLPAGSYATALLRELVTGVG